MAAMHLIIHNLSHMNYGFLFRFYLSIGLQIIIIIITLFYFGNIYIAKL